MRRGRRSPGGPRARAPEGHRLATDTQEDTSDERQLALHLRDEGTATAWSAASPRTRDLLTAALDRLIARGGEFTSDDLRRMPGVEDFPISGSPQTIGAVILTAARGGRIVRVGYRKSERAEARGRVVAVWQGVDR